VLTILKALNVAAVLGAVGLSFVHARWGLPCVALSILCAQWLNQIENRRYADWTQQTLFVVLQSLQNLHLSMKPEPARSLKENA
jgi:hypothetical protein